MTNGNRDTTLLHEPGEIASPRSFAAKASSRTTQPSSQLILRHIATVECIGDLVAMNLPTLLGSEMQSTAR